MRFNVKRYFQVLGISLAVIIAAGAVCMGVDFNAIFGKQNVDKDSTSTVAAENGKINVLMMCVDIDRLRTDAIMLASYDTQTNTANILSIPRDTRMYIGNRYQKINAAHAFVGSDGEIGGPTATCEAVTRLTGVPINYYVDFSFESIAKIIDDIGTVNFDVPDPTGTGEGLKYDDPVQGLHIDLDPGNQDLTGTQVIQLLRYRKNNYNQGYVNGDHDRIALQQEFIKAFVDQKVNAGLILKIPAIFQDILSEIQTNVTLGDVIKYSKYLADFKSTNINTFSLPGTDARDTVNGAVWVPNLIEIREMVQAYFGYDAENITVEKPQSALKSGEDSYEKSGYNDNLIYEEGYYDDEYDN
ncbi:MAG: LCP family protein [Clostridiales bacterium]|nr:LCP family protein [Clostridiales bacterium]